MDAYITDATFANQVYTEKRLPAAEYDGCLFTNCDFSGGQLNQTRFIDCTFKQCNLSNVNLAETVVGNIQFIDCKMLGLLFDRCSDFIFSASFTQCTLNFSSFYKVKLKGTRFKDCILHEVDFSAADLTAAGFINCDLKGATFDGTLLEKADFVSAFNYTIDPDKNKLKNARFSENGLAGLLTRYGLVIEAG